MMHRHLTEEEQLVEIERYHKEGKSPRLLSNKYLYMDFHARVHGQVFIHYCEAILWPDGKVEYAIPSHDEALIKAYANKYNITRDDVIEKFRDNFDWYEQMMRDTGIVQIWYDRLYNCTNLTHEQLDALETLLKYNCISASCMSYITNF